MNTYNLQDYELLFNNFFKVQLYGDMFQTHSFVPLTQHVLPSANYTPAMGPTLAKHVCGLKQGTASNVLDVRKVKTSEGNDLAWVGIRHLP